MCRGSGPDYSDQPLADLFGEGPEQAGTYDATGHPDCVASNTLKAFRTNDLMLHYRRLLYNLCSNTVFCPKILSVHVYMMAEIFATDFGWSQSYPCHARARTMRLLVSYLRGRDSHGGNPSKDDCQCCKGDETGWVCQEVQGGILPFA